jgi:hypothetical protein
MSGSSSATTTGQCDAQYIQAVDEARGESDPRRRLQILEAALKGYQRCLATALPNTEDPAVDRTGSEPPEGVHEKARAVAEAVRAHRPAMGASGGTTTASYLFDPEGNLVRLTVTKPGGSNTYYYRDERQPFPDPPVNGVVRIEIPGQGPAYAQYYQSGWFSAFQVGHAGP